MRILKRIIDFVMEILETITFVASIFIVVYLFILQPNQVKGASMDPTFHDGDYIFTSKITYKLRGPQHGDVIVFRSLKNPDIEFIKRVIALPGEQIQVRDKEVYLNNNLIVENYISTKTELEPEFFLKEGSSLIVPQDMLFVMGDNRPRSSDSREFGPIPEQNIIGVVFYRYFPLSKIGAVKNPFKN